MTWFKVDDGLHAHVKARRAIKESPSSMSLWVLAGSWCADQLTDGWVSQDQARSLMPKTWRRDAAALVKAGFWREEDRDGDPGWVYHEWNEPGRQPTRESVLAERRAAAERQQRARDKARESRQQSRRDSRVSHGVSNGPPDPTRPDQKNKSTRSTAAPSSAPPKRPKLVADDDPDFVRFWAAYPRRQGKLAARKAWPAAIKVADPDTIIEAASRYTAHHGHEERRFIAHPATWLNGERWNDEPPIQHTRSSAAWWDN